MEKAINKRTGVLVDAYSIEVNPTYLLPSEDNWVAPRDSILNWQELEEKNIKEVKVYYVKDKLYHNWRGTLVFASPHFRLEPNSPAHTKQESELHIALKNWLFNRLKNDDLILIYSEAKKPYKYKNQIKLSELNVDWNLYGIEVTTKGIRNLRADIQLPFQKKHPLLGDGLIFEIQLQKQHKKVTYIRTLDRALHGFSVVWLF